MRGALAFALMLGASPLAAQTAPAPQLATPAPADDAAEQLYTILVDPSTMQQRTQEGVERGFDASLQANPQTALVDKRFPGLLAAAKAEARREVMAWAPTMMARMRQQTLQFLRARLTASDMAVIRDFYQTPAGTRMLAAARGSAQEAALNSISDIAARKQTTISADQMSAVQKAGIAGALGAVQPEDRAVIAEFGVTSAAQKLAASQGDFAELIRNTTNAEIAAFSPILSQRLVAFMQSYLAKSRKR